MRFFTAAIISAFAVETLAAPASHVVHESRGFSLRKRARLEATLKLPIRIGLKQPNLEETERLLLEVSHHDSPRYGQYYTAEDVIDLFAPAKSSVDTVRAWLESSGISRDRVSQSVNKQWLQFDGATAELEALLHTEYHHYEHENDGYSHVGCDEYHVPAHISEHIDYITPAVKSIAYRTAAASQLAAPKRKRSFANKPLFIPDTPAEAARPLSDSLVNCSTQVTPNCIRAMYNITLGTKAHKDNQLGIFEDLDDMYAQEDLDLFFTNLFPQIPNGSHPLLDLIDGATAPAPVADAGSESDLDFQISYPIIWPQNSVLFQTDDDVYEANYVLEGFLNNFFDAIDGSYCKFSAFGETGNSPLDPQYPDPAPGGYKGQLQCGVYKATNVISISYGGAESDLPISYQRRQCAEIAKLGLQGVTVFASSGDSGVSGEDGDPTPSNCLGAKQDVFAPQFPASCPFITAVGSTFLPPGANAAIDAEISTTRFPSGGGFSNIYGTAFYQIGAVTNYFAENNPPYKFYESIDNSSFNAFGGIYNRIGRGYPDVSAIGDFVVVYIGGLRGRIGGTSASSPAFASIITRVNEERLAIGKSTVGFINPVLYANPHVLHDITNGSNPGCNTAGFSASKGWDPVSGLGTPNYPELLKLYLSLP